MTCMSSPADVEAERVRAAAVFTELAAEFQGRIKITPIRWEESYYSAPRTYQASILGVDPR